MNKNLNIIQMLNDGKSYTEIQTVLQVSPGKISRVKKEYADQIHLQSKTNSSPDVSSGSSESSSRVVNATSGRGNNIETEIRPFRKTSSTTNPTTSAATTDPKLLLELRKLELAHEEKMQRLRMEEKNRDRALERYKANQAHENAEFNKLRNRISELENQIAVQDEFEEVEFEISKVLMRKLESFFTKDLDLDGDKLDDEDLQELLENAKELKMQVEFEFDYVGKDYDDFVPWQILDKVIKDLDELIEELDGYIFSTSIQYDFDDDLIELLQEYQDFDEDEED